MANLQDNRAHEGLSRRMKLAIIAMLLIILLPTVVVSLPLSRIEVTVKNSDPYDQTTIYVYAYGANGKEYSFQLLPGEENTVTFVVRPGSHDVRVRSVFPDDLYSGEFIGETLHLTMFETEKMYVEVLNSPN